MEELGHNGRRVGFIYNGTFRRGEIASTQGRIYLIWIDGVDKILDNLVAVDRAAVVFLDRERLGAFIQWLREIEDD